MTTWIECAAAGTPADPAPLVPLQHHPLKGNLFPTSRTSEVGWFRCFHCSTLAAARVTFLFETFHLIRFHPRSAIWAVGACRACGRRKNHRFDSQAATSALRARRRRESPRAGRICLEVSCSWPDSRSNLSRIGLRQFGNWPLQQDMLGHGSTYPSARTLASTTSACAASSTRDRSPAGPCPPPRPLWLYGSLASPYGRLAANCLE
jgi:hypothetical protein